MLKHTILFAALFFLSAQTKEADLNDGWVPRTSYITDFGTGITVKVPVGTKISSDFRIKDTKNLNPAWKIIR